jgi:hypothetical protein
LELLEQADELRAQSAIVEERLRRLAIMRERVLLNV